MIRGALTLLLIGIVAACAPAVPQPATFDASTEACRYCRMTGSNGRSAGQIVAPGEEPLFFDDIGCLRDYLAAAPPVNGAVAFVTDYATKAWVRADRAAYVSQPSIDTPMASHLLAFASPAARDASPQARGGRALSALDVFGRKP